MPTIGEQQRSVSDQASLRAADPRISELVHSVRLESAPSASDVRHAKMVPSFLAMSLSGLATLHEQGVIDLNFTARACTLPLVASASSLPEDIESAIGSWAVEGRTQPHELEHIIRQLRRLGVEAIGIYASPSGALEDAEHAWICAANYRDLEKITPAQREPGSETLIITYEGAFPADFNAPSRAAFFSATRQDSESAESAASASGGRNATRDE